MVKIWRKLRFMDFNWLTPKALIKKIENKGYGSFVVEKINQGEIVASFGGFVLEADKLTNFSKDRVARSLQINLTKYLLSGKNPEPGDMLNHSCNPNCGAIGVSSIVAMRDIEIGEELTFDYSMTDASIYDQFDCFCGSSNCRLKIDGNDWENLEIQKKYKGFFSDYVQLLINKS